MQFSASDGFKITFRYWKAIESWRVVICIHGLGDYSGWFSNVAPELAVDGSEVYALDLRGFGESVAIGARRGEVADFNRHLQDIDEFITYLRSQHKGIALYLFGHSLGGAYSLWYAAQFPSKIDGLVLAAPAVVCNLDAANAARKRDPEEIAIMQNDPLEALVLPQVYLSKAISLVNASLENAQGINKPTLILQGSADIIVAEQCAKELYAKLASLDKKLFILEGAGHWFHDALCPVAPRSKCDSKERQQFVSAIKKWLRSH
jgi:alpha-beta hydrolase superfamily lysophospholipase